MEHKNREYPNQNQRRAKFRTVHAFVFPFSERSPLRLARCRVRSHCCLIALTTSPIAQTTAKGRIGSIIKCGIGAIVKGVARSPSAGCSTHTGTTARASARSRFLDFNRALSQVLEFPSIHATICSIVSLKGGCRRGVHLVVL